MDDIRPIAPVSERLEPVSAPLPTRRVQRDGGRGRKGAAGQEPDRRRDEAPLRRPALLGLPCDTDDGGLHIDVCA